MTSPVKWWRTLPPGSAEPRRTAFLAGTELTGQDWAVPTDNAAAWDRFAAAYQSGAQLPTSTAHYGPAIPTEAELRLLGDLKGKRVLELGCGGAQCAIAFVKQGASAIGVDFSAEQLA